MVVNDSEIEKERQQFFLELLPFSSLSPIFIFNK